MNKKIFHYSKIKDKIINAVDTITEPIAATLSPRGSNVIFEDEQGTQFSTNDGVTIAKSLNVKDAVENAIIEIIKGGSLRTNMEVGDGTSSTILMSSVLIKEGLRLIDEGHNQMVIKDKLIKFALDMKKEITGMAVGVKKDNDLKLIATISSNNDEKIASDVIKIIKVVGEDGQVMIDRGFTPETEIIEDNGFIIKGGVFAQELANKQFQTKMEDVPVLITDKRLYYKSEAETILSTVMNAGYNEVVIIAQDFIGDSLPYFVTNHINNKVKVTLIKEAKSEILDDVAIFLGGDVVSDKKGSIVDNITIENFVMAKRVYSDPHKSIISRDEKEKNPDIDKRVKALKSQMTKIGNKNDPEYTRLQKRISSLTTGMVTVKVGGSTHLEVIEKIYRYEDAINAVRAAMKEGYLPGAGVAVYRAFKKLKVDHDYQRMFTAVSEVNIRQIAKNCGKNPDSIVEKYNESSGSFGYNAVTDKMEDMIKAGVIEPLLVTKQVISNAVSIANIIITSRYLIVNDLEDGINPNERPQQNG